MTDCHEDPVHRGAGEARQGSSSRHLSRDDHASGADELTSSHQPQIAVNKGRSISSVAQRPGKKKRKPPITDPIALALMKKPEKKYE